MRIFIYIISILSAAYLTSSCSGFNLAQAGVAGARAIQAASITDSYVEEMYREYVQQLDAQSDVAGPNDPYTIRLNNIVAPIRNSGFNFKVYKTNEVNAFAVADGSIRVYTGLMDLMTDGEVLGVIGHEIGHVMNHDTRDAFRQALLTSAVREGLASTGGVVGAISGSVAGDISEALASSSYSRKQESEADTYGYNFLVSHGVNPWVLVMSFEKLEQAESGHSAGAVQRMFSSHPDIQNRINSISKRATKDGYKRPSASSGNAIYINSANPSSGSNGNSTTVTSDDWTF